jgi:hypothetical protein
MSEILSNKYSFSRQAMYKIVVQGELRRDWASMLGNMKITTENNDKSRSSLIGNIRDQAHLSGILNTLYDLKMTVISVQILPESDT